MRESTRRYVHLNISFIIDHYCVSDFERTKVLLIQQDSNLCLINAVELNRNIITKSQTLARAGLFHIEELCVDSLIRTCAVRTHTDVKVNSEHPRSRVALTATGRIHQAATEHNDCDRRRASPLRFKYLL